MERADLAAGKWPGGETGAAGLEILRDSDQETRIRFNGMDSLVVKRQQSSELVPQFGQLETCKFVEILGDELLN